MIKILHRRQINDVRWNELIASSVNETIYPYTWYLDSCADKWLAFVMNDYECVMPVVYRSKFTLKYSYQPIYCQQLGVYSRTEVDPEIVRIFLHNLQSQFKLGDYSFNEGNLLGDEHGFEVNDNINYVLPLYASYNDIRKNYTENCRRNIKKSDNNDLKITDDLSVNEVVGLKKISEEPRRTDEHYAYLTRHFSQLDKEGKIRIYGAWNGSHLLAAAVFAFSSNRAVFLLSASSEMGKEQRAMFHIVDRFIMEHSTGHLKLDFEGSNIVSIARFFRGFGAKPEVYQRVSFENAASKIIKKLKGV